MGENSMKIRATLHDVMLLFPIIFRNSLKIAENSDLTLKKFTCNIMSLTGSSR